MTAYCVGGIKRTFTGTVGGRWRRKGGKNGGLDRRTHGRSQGRKDGQVRGRTERDEGTEASVGERGMDVDWWLDGSYRHAYIGYIVTLYFHIGIAFVRGD